MINLRILRYTYTHALDGLSFAIAVLMLLCVLAALQRGVARDAMLAASLFLLIVGRWSRALRTGGLVLWLGWLVLIFSGHAA